MSHVTIRGVRIPLANRKKVVDDTTTAFYKKEDLDKLDAHKLNNLFIEAVTISQKKCNFINIKLDDPDILEDMYNLAMAITNTKANHSRFNMHDVFAIVDPNNGYTTTNLYKNHALLTEKEVAIVTNFIRP